MILVWIDFINAYNWSQIEATLKSNAFVDNICIVADGIVNGIVALVIPNLRAIHELATKRFGLTESTSLYEICINKSLVEFVHGSIVETGFEQGLKAIELPSLVTLCHELWSPDNNLLTAAMKLKRANIMHRHASDIEQMFSVLRQDPSKIRVKRWKQTSG